MALYFGLDVGTTGCKAGIFTADGHLISMAYQECSVDCPAPGLAEQDTEAVWYAVRSVLREAAVAAGLDAGEIKALSLSVQGDAVIPVDGGGTPLGPALLGMDRRNLAEAAELAAAVGRERLFAITGMPPHPISSLTKMVWLERHHPRVQEIAGYWHYEEYILHRLGGRALTDLSMASRSMAFDLLKKDYSSEILSAAGIIRNKLAEAVPSGTIAGEIAPVLADELGLPRGLLLVTGGHDQTCAALGAGAVDEGIVVDSVGTAEVCSTALPRPRLEPAMLAGGFPCYSHVVPGAWFTFALIHSGGICLRWLRDTMARAEAAEAAELGLDPYDYLTRDLPDSPGDLIFLPHLVGGGTPYGDQGARGAFVGLTLTTTLKDMTLAVMEGLAMEFRVNLEAMARAGIKADCLRAVGGGARSERWLQIRADITGCKVETLQVREAALLGAALLAATACGEFSGPAEAARRVVKKDRAYLPDPSRRVAYERRYQLYKQVYPALRQINHGLGACESIGG